MNRRRKKSGSIIGSIAGAIMNLFGRKAKTTKHTLKKVDFPTSTQKIGLRFTEKIRDKFRNRWIKKR